MGEVVCDHRAELPGPVFDPPGPCYRLRFLVCRTFLLCERAFVLTSPYLSLSPPLQPRKYDFYGKD